MQTDTVKLLRECDSGAKTAVNSITEMLDKVKNPELLSILTKSLKTHQQLQVKSVNTSRKSVPKPKILLLWQRLCHG